jgi:hypothetical protein
MDSGLTGKELEEMHEKARRMLNGEPELVSTKNPDDIKAAKLQDFDEGDTFRKFIEGKHKVRHGR